MSDKIISVESKSITYQAGNPCLDLETLEKREVVTKMVLLVTVIPGRERGSGLGR